MPRPPQEKTLVTRGFLYWLLIVGSRRGTGPADEPAGAVSPRLIYTDIGTGRGGKLHRKHETTPRLHPVHHLCHLPHGQNKQGPQLARHGSILDRIICIRLFTAVRPGYPRFRLAAASAAGTRMKAVGRIVRLRRTGEQGGK